MPSMPGTPTPASRSVVDHGQINSVAAAASSSSVTSTPLTPERPRFDRFTSPSSPLNCTPSPNQTISAMRLSAGSPQSSRLSTPRNRGTPDRFIPSAASVSSFRMGAPAENLSSDERLLRHHIQNSGSNRDRSNSPERRNTPGTAGAGRSRDADAAAAARGSPLNRRLSAGAIGVFGIGITARAGPDAVAPPRQRGREVNGNIFSNKKSPEKELESHALRLSAALGVDRSRKVLTFTGEREPGAGDIVRRGGLPGSPDTQKPGDVLWASVVEGQNGEANPRNLARRHQRRNVPTTPFRVLDAPGLRDDYYCSLIAYSPTTHSLAVGLHSDVYSWHESTGARPFEAWSAAHVTSLAFSSAQGQNNILAIGRIDGSLTLWNPSEPCPRLEQPHNASIACLAWKPLTTPRMRMANNMPQGVGFTEDLLVGDEMGNIYFYAVNWGNYNHDLNLGPMDASMTIVRRVTVHTQQICGLAWSHDGEQFATGGNDNVAFLFDTCEIEGRRNATGILDPVQQIILEGGDRYRWQHGAAVKAIAFCPWQKTLLATGGGSNDRCIHFFHTTSGATLNTINVSAQVTSLLWSTSHREIAATLGYANPDHPVRIAVYSWPECHQVVQVPWQEDMRALYAVSYPGGPAVSEGSRTRTHPDEDDTDDDEDGRLLRELGTRQGRKSKKKESEGCIVVAASDETVRFHEVWSENRRGVLQWKGVLGGSDILEQLEGIESEGREIVR